MRNDYTDKLIARAQRDEEFRAKLVSDPRSAVSEELGVEIPESLNVRVIEEEADEVVLVLPAAAGEALSEEELAEAAGGSDGWCISAGCPSTRVASACAGVGCPP